MSGEKYRTGTSAESVACTNTPKGEHADYPSNVLLSIRIQNLAEAVEREEKGIPSVLRASGALEHP